MDSISLFTVTTRTDVDTFTSFSEPVPLSDDPASPDYAERHAVAVEENPVCIGSRLITIGRAPA
ncbi:hypothetical protein [Novosphingobium sp.]|uniref:hypothetical protein n=1 Tax=Novosphingobium sp. TaxID=1874826 RepID=UPI0026391FB7|nr:hypothetical protein [Novosphingobium sp.]